MTKASRSRPRRARLVRLPARRGSAGLTATAHSPAPAPPPVPEEQEQEEEGEERRGAVDHGRHHRPREQHRDEEDEHAGGHSPRRPRRTAAAAPDRGAGRQSARGARRGRRTRAPGRPARRTPRRSAGPRRSACRAARRPADGPCRPLASGAGVPPSPVPPRGPSPHGAPHAVGVGWDRSAVRTDVLLNVGTATIGARIRRARRTRVEGASRSDREGPQRVSSRLSPCGGRGGSRPGRRSG